MLRGAIRSGAVEETSATWKAWLLASMKVVAYQRQRIGESAANEGVATPPPPGVFELAIKFEAGEGEVGAPGEIPRGVIENSPAQNGSPESDLRVTDAWKIVAGVSQWLGKIVVDVLKHAGAPAVFGLVCLLLVMVQQRDVRRLTHQVEDLVATVSELRNKIEEE